MTTWNKLYTKVKSYSHDEYDYQIELIISDRADADLVVDKKLELFVYRKTPVLFGLTSIKNKVGTRREECQTNDLPEKIEVLLRRGEEIARDNAQSKEAIENAID